MVLVSSTSKTSRRAIFYAAHIDRCTSSLRFGRESANQYWPSLKAFWISINAR